jgi:6-phosphogluconolactonase
MTTQSQRRDIIVHANPDVLAAAAAARLVTRLVDVQSAGRVPKVVLTGGGIGTALLEQLARGPARDAVDWAHVEFYWGDERFLPPGDPQRNETGARAALLDHLPVDPARVHAMGADTGSGPSGAEAAAEEYAALLARHARPEDHGPVPASRCSAWAGRGTPRRCSRTPPRCTRPSAPSSPCTAARSRRPRGCP